MYQSYWGLQQPPFPLDFDPRYFFPSASVIEAVARFEFALENSYRVAILSGPPGGGKTTLLRHLADRYNKSTHSVVRLSLFGLELHEFLVELLNQLGESKIEARPNEWLWRRLRDRVKLNSFQRVQSVLLLDNASEAEHDVVNGIVRLVHGELQPTSLFSIVLASDEDRLPLLGDRLIELSQLRLELTAWDEADTAEYLRTAIMAAGGDGDTFDTDTALTIHRLANGNPRRVRQLAELTLVAGAGAEVTRIDEELIAAVHHDLVATHRHTSVVTG